MNSERYVLMLRHEIINNKNGELHQFEPPLVITFNVVDNIGSGAIVYSVNRMFRELEHEFLKRLENTQVWRNDND